MNDSVISDPTATAVYLIVLIGVLHLISEIKIVKPFFKYLPPVIWVYFLPMVSSNLDIIPRASPLYDWIRTYFLPPALILMMLAGNISALAKLGPKAITAMFVGTGGIVFGAIVSFAVFHFWLPEESWKGIGALTGSWVGGSANMIAVAASVRLSDAMMSPLIVVDTVVGYTWMGVVIALAVFQDRLDRTNKVNRTIVDGLNKRLREVDQAKRRPIKFIDLAVMLSIAFGIGYVMIELGKLLPDVGAVITSFGWAIILATASGVILSLTRLSELEYAGASAIGSFLFYVLLASIGARADVRGVLNAPAFLLAGVTIIAIHASCLFAAGRYLRLPMFLLATSSQANIGGPVTAPIVATVYQSSLAAVGLLMAVLGNILGTFAGLAVAQVCYWIQ